jgi:uncharacterized protein YndB with AHSA1/START domain
MTNNTPGTATDDTRLSLERRPRRLVFTWAWEGDDGERGHETEVSVTFEAVPGGTRLALVQQSFENIPTRDRHRFGWSSCFDRLTALHAKS